MTQAELFLLCHAMPPSSSSKTVKEILLELNLPLTLQNGQTVLASQAPFAGFIAAKLQSFQGENQ